MSIEREVADDVIHIGLQTISMTAALSVGGGMYLARLIERAAKDESDSKGKKRLESLLNGPGGVEVFPLYKDYEQVFISEAMRHDLKFAIIKDENEKCDVYPLLVSKTDKNIVNRIYEKLKLYDHELFPQICAGEEKKEASDYLLTDIVKKLSEIKSEILKRDEYKKADISSLKDLNVPGAKEEGFPRINNMDKESVRKKMAELKAKREELFSHDKSIEKPIER